MTWLVKPETDVFIGIVSHPLSLPIPAVQVGSLTGELGLASNLSQKLCEVWEVTREELGAEDDIFARV